MTHLGESYLGPTRGHLTVSVGGVHKITAASLKNRVSQQQTSWTT